jgi:hypothetical protein
MWGKLPARDKKFPVHLFWTGGVRIHFPYLVTGPHSNGHPFSGNIVLTLLFDRRSATYRKLGAARSASTIFKLALLVFSVLGLMLKIPYDEMVSFVDALFDEKFVHP